MRMNTTVRKLRPSDYWRIGEHECWFSDMAAKGFHLQKMGLYFAKFVKADPKKMKYRIDVSINKKISEEQIKMYEESGWDHVTSYNYFHVFSSPLELDAPELHTDPAEQSYTLEELDKKLAAYAGLATLATILIIGMLIATWFLNDTPILVLVEGRAIQQSILSIFFGYSAYTSLKAAISIRALRKGLIEGKPIDHYAPWKKHHRLNSIIALLFTVIAGMSAIIPFVQLVKSEAITLPVGSIDLPIVRLADVEQNPALIRSEPSHVRNNIDWGNNYIYDWSPLAPVIYDTDEHGDVPGQMWGDGSGEYSPSIHTKVYQLVVPTIADNLISDLIKRYKYQYSLEDFIERNHPEFDLLIIHEEEAFKEVFASKGKAVIYVRYFGYANVNSIIDNIVEKIHIISE